MTDVQFAIAHRATVGSRGLSRKAPVNIRLSRRRGKPNPRPLEKSKQYSSRLLRSAKPQSSLEQQQSSSTAHSERLKTRRFKRDLRRASADIKRLRAMNTILEVELHKARKRVHEARNKLRGAALQNIGNDAKVAELEQRHEDDLTRMAMLAKEVQYLTAASDIQRICVLNDFKDTAQARLDVMGYQVSLYAEAARNSQEVKARVQEENARIIDLLEEPISKSTLLEAELHILMARLLPH
ncbi:hypothetical protein BDW69DRAFT_180438 [Aspergillus filifer]